MCSAAMESHMLVFVSQIHRLQSEMIQTVQNALLCNISFNLHDIKCLVYQYICLGFCIAHIK